MPMHQVNHRRPSFIVSSCLFDSEIYNFN